MRVLKDLLRFAEKRKRHRSQAFCEPRVTAQAVPIRCDRQVNECRVAVRDGLIKAVERFIEPACCPIQNGAEECHLQQDVEVQLRVRDLIHPESVHPGEAGRCVHPLHVRGDLFHHRHPLFGKAPRDGLADGPGRESIDVPDLPIDVVNELARQHMPVVVGRVLKMLGSRGVSVNEIGPVCPLAPSHPLHTLCPLG